MHHDIDTIERMEIIRDLRLGKFDVLVGINLLREGLDLPEVSLVAILDADKEGFLRSETSLIQTIGRAARNADGMVILYADTVTPPPWPGPWRRRSAAGPSRTPTTRPTALCPRPSKSRCGSSWLSPPEGEGSHDTAGKQLTRQQRMELIARLEKEMKEAAKMLEFELAATPAGSDHPAAGGEEVRGTPDEPAA